MVQTINKKNYSSKYLLWFNEIEHKDSLNKYNEHIGSRAVKWARLKTGWYILRGFESHPV